MGRPAGELSHPADRFPGGASTITTPRNPALSASLRHDLKARALQWATGHDLPHGVSKDGVVIFREFHAEDRPRHGNFDNETYRRISAAPPWRSRLTKLHSRAGKIAEELRASGHATLDARSGLVVAAPPAYWEAWDRLAAAGE